MANLQHVEYSVCPKANVLQYKDKKWQTPTRLRDVQVKHCCVASIADSKISHIYALDDAGNFITTNESVWKELKNKKIKKIIDGASNTIYFLTSTGELIRKLLNEPRVQKVAKKVEEVYCGAMHTFIKTNNQYKVRGGMYQFGFGHIQLRSDSFIGHSNIDNLDIATLYVGGWHNFAKTKNGQFYGWGYDMGRLGTGTSNGHCQVPTRLPFEKYNFSKLIPGWWHSMGLSHDGDLYAWGHGTEGSLGQGTINTIPVPTLILSSVKDAFTGKDIVNNMAVRIDNKLYAWGRNRDSQLGFESTSGVALYPEEVTSFGIHHVSNVIMTQENIIVLLDHKKELVLKNAKQLADVYFHFG